MVKKILAEFKVEYLQILDENGKVDEQLMPKISDKFVKKFYESMILIRLFDSKAIALQRQGRIGTYASLQGQEATQVAPVSALTDDDWLIPSYREGGAMILRGFPMSKIFQFWGGDERGHYVKGPPHILPIAIPVSSQTLHGAGIAMALKLQKKKAAALCYFGDGASSKGDFHEAANFAGVFKAPCVFMCCNNQWAISLPRKRQTASETIAQKAIAYGFEGIQVDGNDIFAMYKATTDALKKAYAGKGPTLIEAYTYRLGDHTTSDSAKKYRDANEVEEWKKRDPITRLQKYMKDKSLWDEKYEDEVQTKSKETIEAAVKEFENTPPPEVDDIFKYTFAEMPAELQEQLNNLKQLK